MKIAFKCNSLEWSILQVEQRKNSSTEEFQTAREPLKKYALEHTEYLGKTLQGNTLFREKPLYAAGSLVGMAAAYAKMRMNTSSVEYRRIIEYHRMHSVCSLKRE